MLNDKEIKAAASIERVVASYLELKKDGERFVALCPFHSERTPSFTVTPVMQIFKCFGCDAAGDVFEFVQKIEDKSFPDAVRTVAEIVGVPVTESKPERGNFIKATVPKKQGLEAAPYRPQQAVEIQQKLVAAYSYPDLTREVRYEVLRHEPGKNGKAKDFRQRRPMPEGRWAWGLSAGTYEQRGTGDWYPAKVDSGGPRTELPEVERLLWRLPEIADSYEVVICEGERGVLTLEALGFVATTLSGGSKQPWLESYSEVLRGKKVIIMPDNDAPGEAHGRKIEKALGNIAAELVYVQIPQGLQRYHRLGCCGKKV